MQTRLFPLLVVLAGACSNESAPAPHAAGGAVGVQKTWPTAETAPAVEPTPTAKPVPPKPSRTTEQLGSTLAKKLEDAARTVIQRL